MPVTYNFIDLLTHIAPGFVILYAFRAYSHVIRTLLNPNGVSSSPTMLLPLLFMALAIGVIVAGCSSVIIPFFSKFFSSKKGKIPLPEAIDMKNLFSYNVEKLKLLSNFSRSYQSFANMFIALFVSLLVLIYHIYKHAPIEYPYAKLFIIFLFTLLMLIASVKRYRLIIGFAIELSGKQKAVSQENTDNNLSTNG